MGSRLSPRGRINLTATHILNIYNISWLIARHILLFMPELPHSLIRIVGALGRHIHFSGWKLVFLSPSGWHYGSGIFHDRIIGPNAPLVHLYTLEGIMLENGFLLFLFLKHVYPIPPVIILSNMVHLQQIFEQFCPKTKPCKISHKFSNCRNPRFPIGHTHLCDVFG